VGFVLALGRAWVTAADCSERPWLWTVGEDGRAGARAGAETRRRVGLGDGRACLDGDGFAVGVAEAVGVGDGTAVVVGEGVAVGVAEGVGDGVVVEVAEAVGDGVAVELDGEAPRAGEGLPTWRKATAVAVIAA